MLVTFFQALAHDVPLPELATELSTYQHLAGDTAGQPVTGVGLGVAVGETVGVVVGEGDGFGLDEGVGVEEGVELGWSCGSGLGEGVELIWAVRSQETRASEVSRIDPFPRNLLMAAP